MRPTTTLAVASPRTETGLTTRYSRVQTLWAKEEYAAAGKLASGIAKDAERTGDDNFAAKAWRVAGSASLIDLRLKDALSSYMKALAIARLSRDPALILSSYTSLAALYLQLDDPASARHYALLGLGMPPLPAQRLNNAVLQLTLARSTAKLRPFPEALPHYRASLALFEAAEDEKEFQLAVTGWNLFGGDALQAGQLDLAEAALHRAFYLSGMHGNRESATILRKLARLRDKQGDLRSAAALYHSAELAPPDITPRWLLYADRGEFRLAHGDASGALADFRGAAKLVKRLRADIVPNDQGRVNLENGLARIADGLIEAGNRVGLFEETLEAAEQSRSSSLAAITPVTDDWRAKLPATYWDLLRRYRMLPGDSRLASQGEALRLQLGEMEAAASVNRTETSEPALHHVRSVLSPDDVFFSFHVGEQKSWLWVVSNHSLEVVALPARADLETLVQQFRKSVLESDNFDRNGRSLYLTLFGKIPKKAAEAKRWIIAFDGPLFDLPVAALVLPRSQPGKPVFLCEKVALQLAPGALLLRKGRSLSGGSFVGIADPIYNAADSRYHGSGTPQSTLPRLPASRTELTVLAKEWGTGHSTLLLGPDTNLNNVISTLRKPPTILHFGTHVIPSSGEYRSGLIALGLRPDGRMDLLGPMEIVSHRVEAELVVLNGCHSGQAQTVPGSGLMGLTRAWIGSGANAVLATQWDVPDDASQALMVQFYRSLKEKSDENIALSLQRAWIKLLQNQETRQKPATWAAYFLLART